MMKAVVLLAAATGALAEPASFPMRSVGIAAGDVTSSHSGRELRFFGVIENIIGGGKKDDGGGVANGDKHTGNNKKVEGDMTHSTDNSETNIDRSDNTQDHSDHSEHRSDHSETTTDENKKYTDNSYNGSNTEVDDSEYDFNSGTQIGGDKSGYEILIG